MRIAQKKRYDESDVEALNKIASRAGRNKTFRLALTAFGIIDLGAAAASSYFHKQPWTFLICGSALLALANVIVPQGKLAASGPLRQDRRRRQGH